MSFRGGGSVCNHVFVSQAYIGLGNDFFRKGETESMVTPTKLCLTKDKFKVEQVLGENTVQVQLTKQVKVPDEKPDIRQLIKAHTEARVLDKEIILLKKKPEKVLVEGEVEAQILYVADVLEAYEFAGPVHHFKATLPFAEAVPVPNLEPCQENCLPELFNSLVDVKVEDVAMTIIDCRTVELSVVLKLRVKVTEFVQMNVVTEMKGVDIISERERLVIEDVINEGTTQKLLRNILAVPEEKLDIEKILHIDTDVIVDESRVIKDKVILEGWVVYHILYVAGTLEGDQPVHHMHHKVKFSHYIHLDGVRPGEHAQVQVVREANIEKLVDCRHVQIESVLKLFVKVTKTRQLWVVTNAYGFPKLRLEKCLLKVDDIIGEATKQITESFELKLPGQDFPEFFADQTFPAIEKVLHVTPVVTITQTNIIADKVVIEGQVKFEIMYVAETLEGDQPVHFIEFTEPFTLFIDVPGARSDFDLWIRTKVEAVTFRLTEPCRIDVDVILAVTAKVTKIRQLRVVVDAVLGDTLDP